MSYARLPVFERFIGDLRAVWSAETDDARRMENAKPLVEAFVKDPDLKAHSAQWPSTEGRKNLLLYVDPAYEFVVNAVVRVPGRTGSVHDHANAWVLYGVLDGTESLERQAARPRRGAARFGDDRHPGQGRSGAAARHPCRARRPDPFGRHHRAQPAARRGNGASAHVRSQGANRRRAIRPDADSLRPFAVTIAPHAWAAVTTEPRGFHRRSR
jgi:hypothetical protein